MATITFRNDIQVALFDEELRGQLSDGFWENSRPYDHWRVWTRAETRVARKGELLGRDFHADKSNYNFNNTELLTYVGDRMLEICQKVAGQGYTMAMMRKELKDMNAIIRTRLANNAVIE